MASNDITSTVKELNITRVFDAPRELVFNAWTDPAHMAKWWGPAEWTNPVCEMDVRPGGKILIVMTGPGWPENPMKGEFLEVVRPEKLVFTSKIAESEPGVFGLEAVNTVMFTETNGKTTLTLKVKVTKAIPAMAPALAGQKAGWNQSLDRLFALLTGNEEFVITRPFDAPRDLVWKVYSDAEHLAQWWGPKGFTMRDITLDFREGGMFHYGMKGPDGSTMWGKFIYREIDAPERMSFVVSFSDEAGGITRHPMSATWPKEVLSTLTFFEMQGKTAIIMSSVPINATEEERNTFNAAHDGMKQGFKGTFDQLDAYLAIVKR